MGVDMPGPQVKIWPKYEALRRKGFGKTSAAKITNAGTGPKRPKSKVNYRRGSGSRTCSACQHFRAGRCAKVLGPVSPGAVCDLFHAK